VALPKSRNSQNLPFRQSAGQKGGEKERCKGRGNWAHTGAAASKAKEKLSSGGVSYSKNCVLGHGPGVPGTGLVRLQTRGYSFIK